MTHQVSLMTLATVLGVGISIAGVGTEPAAATQAEPEGRTKSLNQGPPN